jgi:pyridoxal phosphate enzyme (YggS family)
VSMAAVDGERLEERIATLRTRIARAAAPVGRDPSEVRIVAVTKTHPVELARAAVAAGLDDLGENRVDELVAKSGTVDARWHLIGQLQRNKVRAVVGRAALIHSVDRRSLVDALSRAAQAAAVVQDVLVQVNVAEDPAKGGCSLAELPGLVSYASDAPGLRVVGLMTVPPLPDEGVAPAEAARPHFRALRDARDALRSEHPGLEELSMGMSDDLEAAVQEGATMVRVGSALFGAREEVTR